MGRNKKIVNGDIIIWVIINNPLKTLELFFLFTICIIIINIKIKLSIITTKKINEKICLK